VGTLRIQLQLPWLSGWVRRDVDLEVDGVSGRIEMQVLDRAELLAADARDWRSSGRMPHELAVRMPPALTVSLAPLGVHLSAGDVERLVSATVGMLAASPPLTSTN
jgi:hypothetical protein